MSKKIGLENSKFNVVFGLVFVATSIVGNLTTEASTQRPNNKECVKRCNDNYQDTHADVFHDLQEGLRDCLVQARCVTERPTRLYASCDLCVSDYSDRTACLSCQDSKYDAFDLDDLALKAERDACISSCPFQSPIQSSVVLQN